jgi:cation/acetate symporter
MRSLTWMASAQGIIALLALVAPAVLLAILLTNLPLPQITFGTLADDVGLLEAGAGINARLVSKLAISQPGIEPEHIVKPFMQPFGASGSFGFAALALTVALGIASLPALCPRASAALGVSQVRRAMGWTLVITAGVLLTLPALALFARFELLAGLAGRSAGDVPDWLHAAERMGLAVLDREAGIFVLDQLRVARDGVLVLLPMASGFPEVLVMVALAGAIAAVLAAAAAQVHTIAALWCEDIVFAWSEIGSACATRLAVARGAAALVVAVGAWLAVSVGADPLTLFTWALALAASSAFPPLVMSVWWKRINQWGAMAGVTAGFGTVLVLLLLTLAGVLPAVFERSGAFATVIAVPLAAATAILVSLMTPSPDKRSRELVRDIRVPGGETVYERELRLARIGKRGPA